jgi:hypothetical protein
VFAWYDKNTGEFFLEGLRDSQAASGVYLNAGVTFTVEAIRDAKKQLVTGPAYPVAGAYVAGTDGVWAARIGWQSALVLGRKYWAELKTVVGGVDGTWQVEFEVRERVVR